jgi:hypothetical protein
MQLTFIERILSYVKHWVELFIFVNDSQVLSRHPGELITVKLRPPGWFTKNLADVKYTVKLRLPGVHIRGRQRLPSVFPTRESRLPSRIITEQLFWTLRSYFLKILKNTS